MVPDELEPSGVVGSDIVMIAVPVSAAAQFAGGAPVDRSSVTLVVPSVVEYALLLASRLATER
jgi:hypothetical protein